VNADGAGVTQLGRPGVAAGVEFLMRTLDLAQTMLRAASDSGNPEHVTFCRSSARDFLSSVTRLLPHVEPAEGGRSEVIAAADALESQLSRLGC